MIDKGMLRYASEFTNYIDCISAVINLVLIINQDFIPGHVLYDFQTQKTLAAVAIAFVWYKSFYWMRLFDSTAFFMNLLKAILQDI